MYQIFFCFTSSPLFLLIGPLFPFHGALKIPLLPSLPIVSLIVRVIIDLDVQYLSLPFIPSCVRFSMMFFSCAIRPLWLGGVIGGEIDRMRLETAKVRKD